MTVTANQVRIIGGRHRGRRVRFAPGAGLRPTPDRVRETLFNWLQHEVPGARCLDLFAGSGALGLEALSRGAAHLLAVERNRAAVERLRENIALLHEQDNALVVQDDALRLLKSTADRPYDLVFVDPPFAAGLLGDTCRLLEQHGWLSDAAIVYLEQDAKHPWPELPGNWTLHRQGVAGQSAQRLLRRSKPG
ncbi:MAG: 16S rRNA (guanine(966)-N(2))-methyltransferase RsmD [Gammaproteobacteria bacterium]|nr:16S rRNA (guanine(966)-N(2))-methyltransferase RsmD [Gammaproteobacteria bacterium]